jgi:MFS transporter, DHA1 family, staphyloferrin A biosynthesis exporter
LLWIGSMFSGTGMWVQQATIGWVTYDLTGSPFLLGVVNGARSVPALLLGPFGGVAADRFDRKTVMLTSQVSNVLLNFGFAVLIATGYLQVWHLFAFALLSGVSWAFNMPVRTSIIPGLVPRADLMNALALNSAGFNFARVFGPAVAGILIAVTGPAENFFLQSAAYLMVTILVLQIRFPASAGRPRGSVAANLQEGAAFIWKNPALRAQMAIGLVPSMIAMPYSALLPIFAADVLHVGPEGFGLLMAAPGLGAVVGTLSLASLPNLERKGLLLLGSLLSFGVLLVLLALSRSFALDLLLLVAIGAAQMASITTNQTLVQLLVPDELRGRVMGVYMLNQGLYPLGSLFAGALADVLGAPPAVAIMGVLVTAFALLYWGHARTADSAAAA